MEAKEKALTFLREQFLYIIPYFQRGYVWNEDNWEGIWQELIADREDCFLGSIILKKEKYPGKSEECKTVIDGQQRLTTLSILLRAFWHYYESKGADENSLAQFKDLTLYHKSEWLPDGVRTHDLVKIEHSRLNRKDYEDIITGRVKPEDIVVDEVKPEDTSKILRCYRFFYDKLCTSNEMEFARARQKLIVDASKILVVIDLNERENEQVIFDTINSTGVKLTASDIIKNSLFQKFRSSIVTIEQLYHTTWEQSFEYNSDMVDQWLATKGIGQNQRSNIDHFFYSFAIVKGFFHVPGDKMSDLATKYKEHISKLEESEAEIFIHEICDYAETYRETFIGFDNVTCYSYNDAKTRLLQILDAVKITAFDPFILHALKTYNEEKQNELFAKLECYVMRHYIIGNTTKMGRFLMDAADMIQGKFDFEEKLSDNLISDTRFERSLMYINNTKAKLILFWIELHRHTIRESDLYNTPLNYAYELEHIMPQKWRAHWSLEDIPVFDAAGERVVSPDADRIRSDAVYEIGNMTLLTSRLNKELQNYSFTDKVNGTVIGKKQRLGMKEFAALSVTKEVINTDPLVWDEKHIRERTLRLSEEAKCIWPVQ